MENEFHLSIRNHQRKIGDVRDLFRNLTNEERRCLEKEKILSELKINEIRKKRDLEEQEQLKYQYNNKIENETYLNNRKSQLIINRNFSFQNTKKMNDNNNNGLTSYEKNIMKAYGALSSEANEDYGRYLDDDDDDDYDDNEYYNRRLKLTDNDNIDDRTRISKKHKKLSINGKSRDVSIESSKKNNNNKTSENHLTDMCGFYTVELPPKERERVEKLKQQQTKGGLAGLKNKIKQFFTNDDDLQSTASQYSRNVESIRSDKGPRTDDKHNDATLRYSYYPRTIQDVQFYSSKIGFQAGQPYEDYYNQVDDLRKFDYEARLNNLKWKPNDNVAIMDDDLNVKYTKSKKLNKKDSFKNNDQNSNKKPNKLNKLTEAIFSKAKNLRT